MLEIFSSFTGIELEEKMYKRLNFHSKSSDLAFHVESELPEFSKNDSHDAYEQLIKMIKCN
ncbi:hypothetical protein D3C87_1641500 [compost metagenome]